MAKRDILLIGGARSGKSRYAQELAVRMGGPVLFVATATAGDAEMQQRIAAHRKARPADWRTLEATADLGREINRMTDMRVVIVDCITLLVNNVLTRCTDPASGGVNAGAAGQGVEREIAGLADCLHHSPASFIIVTNDVGLGLVPETPLGRLYRDLLGGANQKLAAAAGEVYLMVAGLPVTVKPG